MTRREFLRISAVGGLAAGSPWVGRAQSALDGPTSEDLLAGTAERIERHRTRPVLVRVRGRDGRPARNTEVRIEQVRHEFKFGANLFMLHRFPDADQEATYQRRFASLFNAATLGFYWASFEPEEGKPQYDRVDRAVAWCQERLITPKGHPLAWDHDASSPKWLPVDLCEVGELSSERVKDIVTRYRGRIDWWDVVNEPRHLGNPRFRQEAHNHMGQWGAWLGPHEYTSGHLKVARKANPNALLTVNEHQLDAGYLALLESLRERGRWLFDIVGLQSHMHDGPWPLTRVWELCETFRSLGLPLHFTEITVLSGPRTGSAVPWGPTEPELESKQAEYVAQLYTLLFSHPAVGAAIWWDLADRGAWQGAAAGLLRRDLSPKPAYERLHGLLKDQWWTRAEGGTDDRGEFRARVYRGLHRVTVTPWAGPPVVKVVGWEGADGDRLDVNLR